MENMWSTCENSENLSQERKRKRSDGVGADVMKKRKVDCQYSEKSCDEVNTSNSYDIDSHRTHVDEGAIYASYVEPMDQSDTQCDEAFEALDSLATEILLENASKAKNRKSSGETPTTPTKQSEEMSRLVDESKNMELHLKKVIGQIEDASDNLMLAYKMDQPAKVLQAKASTSALWRIHQDITAKLLENKTLRDELHQYVDECKKIQKKIKKLVKKVGIMAEIAEKTLQLIDHADRKLHFARKMELPDQLIQAKASKSSLRLVYEDISSKLAKNQSLQDRLKQKQYELKKHP